MLVYVAGPLSIGDKLENTLRAMAVGKQVLKRGHYPLLPHLTYFCEREGDYDLTWAEYLEWDMAFLLRCDALLRLPGDSPGADREEALARAAGIPVFHSIEELPDA